MDEGSLDFRCPCTCACLLLRPRVALRLGIGPSGRDVSFAVPPCGPLCRCYGDSRFACHSLRIVAFRDWARLLFALLLVLALIYSAVLAVTSFMLMPNGPNVAISFLSPVCGMFVRQT